MAKISREKATEFGFDPERLGAEVRRLRKEKSLTQEELAKISDVSKPGLVKLEGGSAVPSIPMLERIARHLGVDLSDLIRTGYEADFEPQSSALTEIMDLARKMTEPRRKLALRLMQAAFYHKER